MQLAALYPCRGSAVVTAWRPEFSIRFALGEIEDKQQENCARSSIATCSAPHSIALCSHRPPAVQPNISPKTASKLIL